MRKTRQLAWAAPLVVAALLGTAACGSSSSSSSSSSSTGGTTSTAMTDTTGSSTSSATTNAALCAAVANFKASLTGMKNLSKSSSVSDFATATGNVSTAWAQLQTAAKSVKGVDTTALGNAVNTFTTTMTSLPSKGLSFSQDIDAAKQAVVPLETAVKDLAPNCGS
jgi:hypothetical protein